ncbi:DUF2007 domain-containing protein [Candidatus Parcubacteria bacterium]|nr:DUF2007 domain-containing protein [Candidatus Parcubacteria bacterium]
MRKNLTKVYFAKNLIEAEIKKGYLMANGIRSFIYPDNYGCPEGGYFPVGYTAKSLSAHLVYVKKEDVKKAMELLKSQNKKNES